MNYYYFNKNTDENNNHEVHTSTCSHGVKINENKADIGYFNNCKEAIKKAKNDYPSKTFDGCSYCCEECHSS